jgi:2'-5' RNA ligase
MDIKYYYNRISVPEHINKEIQRYKKASAKYIGKFPSEKSPGHISFRCLPLTSINSNTSKNVDLYYNHIERYLSKVPAITLYIIGFNYLTHGKTKRTIYAKLNLDADTLNWFNVIMSIFLPGKALKKPHITIARSISIEQFNVLWPYFQNLDYKDSFRVDCLDVLQQNTDNRYNPMLPYKKINLCK